MGKLMSILIGAFATLWLLGQIRSEPNKIVPASPAPAQTAEEKAEDKFLVSAVMGAKSLKAAMRDPDSFKLESALLMGNGDAVCYSYRARNGFNGMNVGYAVLVPKTSVLLSSDSQGFTSAWKKSCNGKTGSEVVGNVLQLM